MNRVGKAIDRFIEKDQEKNPIGKQGFIEVAMRLGNKQLLAPDQRGWRARGKMTKIKAV